MAGVRFLRELRRRQVFRVAAGYAVVGWLLIQISTQVFPFFDLPSWSVRLIVLIILAGFPIALVLAWAFDVTPAGIVRTAPAEGAPAHRSHRAGIAVGLVGVLVSAMAGMGYWYWHRPSADEVAPPAAAAKSAAPAAATKTAVSQAPAAPAGDKSIAVLPFASLSDDKANAYFADGMQDEILTKLSKIGALRVISRTSTQRFANIAEKNLAEIAQQLGVTNILEGSVQKAGNRVHINVQLIRAASDEHLWAESYNKTLDDIFGVEGEVAQAVADALRAALTGAEQQVVAAKPTQNAAAYDAWLRGRALMDQGYSFVGAQRTMDALLEATRHDPQFALAWAYAALVMSNQYFNGYNAEQATAERVGELADTALRLQPDLGEALLARGAYRYRVLRDYPAALEDLLRAHDRTPNDQQILETLFFLERRIDRWDEAFAHLQLALDRDPRSVQLLAQAGCDYLVVRRRFDEARATLGRALDIDARDATVLACLAQVEQMEGRLDAADALLAKVPMDVRDFYEGLMLVAQLAYRGRNAEIVSRLQAVASSPDEQLSGVDLLNMVRLGHAQRAAGDAAGAKVTFQRLVHLIETRPGGIDHMTGAGSGVPGLAYAGLGDCAGAIRVARHTVEFWRGDAVEKPNADVTLAQVYAQCGRHDDAIAMLPELLKVDGGITSALLREDPLWDSLRKDPRFQALAGQPHAATAKGVTHD